jgi:hypothetical protein
MQTRLHRLAAVALFLVGLIVVIVAYATLGHGTSTLTTTANGYASLTTSQKPSVTPFIIAGVLMALGVAYGAWAFLFAGEADRSAAATAEDGDA